MVFKRKSWPVKMTLIFFFVLTLLVAAAGAVSAFSSAADGTHRVRVTALQERNDRLSQMNGSILQPATLRIKDGIASAVIAVTGSRHLGVIRYQNAAGEFEAAEVVADDKAADRRTIRIPVVNTDSPLMLQTVIIPAGGITVRFRLNIEKESLQPGVTVMLDGREMAFEVPPYIKEGQAMVPFRALFEALGAVVEWDQATRTVSATRGETVVRFVVGGAAAYKNDQPVTLDVPAEIINSRVMIPLSFAGASLGADVVWEELSNTAMVDTSAGQEINVTAMHATTEGAVSSADRNLVKPARYKVLGSQTYVFLTMNSADVISDLGTVTGDGNFKKAEVTAENMAGATSSERTRTYKIAVANLTDPVLLQMTVDRGAMGKAQVQFRLVFNK